ncbi:MAG: hypothetical protein IJO46_13370, partial [Thermoguttaceae bacterium]|nr:hypothetical protein [Thermoguttaceae bacterium]
MERDFQARCQQDLFLAEIADFLRRNGEEGKGEGIFFEKKKNFALNFSNVLLLWTCLEGKSR